MFRNDDNDDDDDDDVEISVEDELAVGLDDKTFTASLRRSVTLLIFAMIYPERVGLMSTFAANSVFTGSSV